MNMANGWNKLSFKYCLVLCYIAVYLHLIFGRIILIAGYSNGQLMQKDMNMNCIKIFNWISFVYFIKWTGDDLKYWLTFNMIELARHLIYLTIIVLFFVAHENKRKKYQACEWIPIINHRLRKPMCQFKINNNKDTQLIEFYKKKILKFMLNI